MNDLRHSQWFSLMMEYGAGFKNYMINIDQIKAARAMLGLKQSDLADRAGISVNTLNNIERGAQVDPKPLTMRAIQMALEAAGIEFLFEETGGVGLRRKTTHKKTEMMPKVLIVDDNSTDRKLYRSWLNKDESRQYNITDACNAEDGYKAFVSEKPACILLDFMMYDKTGFQMLAEMRRENTHVPPVIFITGMNDRTVKNAILSLGIHNYLCKDNLTPEKLCDAVEMALA